MGVGRLKRVIHVAGPALSPLALGLLMRKPVAIKHHGFQAICPTGQLFMERTGAPCPGHYYGWTSPRTSTMLRLTTTTVLRFRAIVLSECTGVGNNHDAWRPGEL